MKVWHNQLKKVWHMYLYGQNLGADASKLSGILYIAVFFCGEIYTAVFDI